MDPGRALAQDEAARYHNTSSTGLPGSVQVLPRLTRERLSLELSAITSQWLNDTYPDDDTVRPSYETVQALRAQLQEEKDHSEELQQELDEKNREFRHLQQELQDIQNHQVNAINRDTPAEAQS